MKKVITICLLVVTLLVGAMTIDAKTTKKKTTKKTTRTSASRSSIDGASYLDSSTFMSDEGFYSPSSIADDLMENGNFKLKSTSKVRTEYGDGYITAKKTVYDGGNVTVSIYAYDGYTIEVDIKFTTTSILNAFIERMEDQGWEYSYSNSGTKSYYWQAGGMYVRGLSVTLTYGG